MSTPYIGIDIGKNRIHVARMDDQTPPRTAPVITIEMTALHWYKELAIYVPAGAIVALEPSGWHLSRPIVAVLERRNCKIVYIAHNATANLRRAHISSQKTDETDARALALAARLWLSGQYLIGVSEHNPDLEDLNIALRLLLNKIKKTRRDLVSAKNRLKAFSYGMWPLFSQRQPTWLRAARTGHVTPDEIQQLATTLTAYSTSMLQPPLAVAYRSATARRALLDMAADIPNDIQTPPAVRAAVTAALDDLLTTETRLHAAMEEIEAIIWSEPLQDITGLWMTVPGSGPLLIAALFAASKCDPLNFTADAFRAAVGCHPSRQESGRITEARDNKRGFRLAKALLHLQAMTLLSKSKRPNPIADYFDRLKARGNRFAIHAARGKLARIYHGIAINGQPCNWPAAGQMSLKETAK